MILSIVEIANEDDIKVETKFPREGRAFQFNCPLTINYNNNKFLDYQKWRIFNNMKSRYRSNLIRSMTNSSLGRIIVITGARQVGKTTLTKKTFPCWKQKKGFMLLK